MKTQRKGKAGTDNAKSEYETGTRADLRSPISPIPLSDHKSPFEPLCW